MIRKIGKSCSSPYGIEIDQDVFKRPCIFGVFPEDSHHKMLNGYLNKILYLMQIRHFGEIDSNYDISTIPFDVIVYEKNDNTSVSQFLDRIPSNNLDVAKELVRNINIISYCYGHSVTYQLINTIHDGLLKKGYSEEQVSQIMQNIFVLQIVDNFVLKKHLAKFPYVTSLIVHDIDDFENIQYQNIKPDYLHTITVLSDFERDIKILLYKSFGEGSLSKDGREHEFTRDYIYAPILNAYMSFVLVNVMKSSLRHTDLSKTDIMANLEQLHELVIEYMKNNPKELTEYTKKDLRALNQFLMQKVQEYCIGELSLIPLTKEQKTSLENHDDFIRSYSEMNFNDGIMQRISSITYCISSIFNYYDNYDKNEEVMVPANIVVYRKVSDIILDKIHKLISEINDLLAYISGFKLPDKINNAQVQKEHSEYIHSVLNQLKGIVNNEKLLSILDEYQMTGSFTI